MTASVTPTCSTTRGPTSGRACCRGCAGARARTRSFLDWTFRKGDVDLRARRAEYRAAVADAATAHVLAVRADDDPSPPAAIIEEATVVDDDTDDDLDA